MRLLKLPLFAELLKDGSVFVYVIPTRDLVAPENLEYPVPFEYGHNLPNPIPDLSWSERGIHATLSFGTMPFKTFVPWESVIGMKPQGQGVLISWSTDDHQANVDMTVHQTTPPPITPKPRLTIVK